MLRTRLVRPGEVRLLEEARPVPGAGEVLVQIEAAGICGSDRHMVKGEYPTAPNVTLGHEFCGVIVEAGAGVRRLKPGTRITADPNIACGHCAACRAGRVNLCSSLNAIGVTRDGGFAEYALVPEGQAIALPADLDPVLGAFSEPLACCLHGLDVAAIRPGDSVAVFGGGVIGLIMVQLALLAGAARVVLITRQAARRSLALATGATDALDPAAGPVNAALRDLIPGGVDVALECAGVPETVTGALDAVRHGGAMVLFGVMAKGERVAIEPFDLLVREVRLLPAYLNPHTHQRAADMIVSGQLKLAELVSRTIGLDEFAAEVTAAPRQGDVKVMVRPGT